MTKLVRNLRTPEARAYWESAQRVAERVALWPEWKRVPDRESADRSMGRGGTVLPQGAEAPPVDVESR